MSFSNEWTVKATKKPHRCCACRCEIPAGSSIVRWSGMTDGEFASLKYHHDCREAEVALNALNSRYSDEWISLRDYEREDMPWIRERFPAVAARLFNQEAAHG